MKNWTIDNLKSELNCFEQQFMTFNELANIEVPNSVIIQARVYATKDIYIISKRTLKYYMASFGYDVSDFYKMIQKAKDLKLVKNEFAWYKAEKLLPNLEFISTRKKLYELDHILLENIFTEIQYFYQIMKHFEIKNEIREKSII